MKHTAKALRMLCSVVVMLVLAASITAIPAYAASNGIYLATATPHYRHPTTGVIEDAGGDGSAVLGQSMTESALYRQALVEVDPHGTTYVTVRLKLMDNIQNPQFQVDSSAVSASLMQEDYTENTADYRMRVGSENSVIRCNMYVVPMGREVIFYITVSALQSGSGDFITSVTVEKPSTPASEPADETPAKTPAETTPDTQTPAASDTKPAQDSTKTGESGQEETPRGSRNLTQTAIPPRGRVLRKPKGAAGPLSGGCWAGLSSFWPQAAACGISAFSRKRSKRQRL